MMLFVDLLEFIGAVLLVWFFITQVAVPIIIGTPLYPLFRSKESKLKKELAEARQKIVEGELKKKVTETKSRI